MIEMALDRNMPGIWSGDVKQERRMCTEKH